jgi:hypothetical protein
MGSIKNDVRYIQHSRDGHDHGVKIDDEVLSTAKG